MDNALLVLKPSGDTDEACADDNRPEAFKHLWPYNYIGDARLIFEGRENHALRRARTLADKNDAGNGNPPSRL